MATTIVTKNGSGAPTASDLVAGELAVDLTNKRLYTEDSGGTVLELGTNPSGNVTFGDNGKAIFGAGSDLQIYHNGSHSIISDTGTGNLKLGGTGLELMNGALSEYYLAAVENAGVYLYYDNAAKLTTTATGIDVTGTVTADGLTVDGTSNFNGTINAKNVIYLKEPTSGAVNGAVFIADTQEVGIQAFGASGHITFDTGSGLTQRMQIASNGDISFYEDTGTTPKLFWDASAESLGIGTNLPSVPLHIENSASTSEVLRLGSSTVTHDTGIYMRSTGTSAISWGSGGNLAFYGGGAGTAERMRIDASGNLLVGKTSLEYDNTAGHIFRADGFQSSIRSGGNVVDFNRVGSSGTEQGEVIRVSSNGTTEGSIGVASSVLTIFATSTSNCGIGFYSNSTVRPLDNSGALADDAIDLGDSGTRWDDIYATNGTIQTSDRNEKQDIEELSDAEQRVAVAAKGLLRKFRWKSSVAEKGDDARTHFGIIAQDLQAAFEAEGLDAGDYAMFINSTWTDEETGEERSRMGVRYSELLAFIIAAI